MELLTTIATALGAYRLLPRALRGAVETAVDAWVEQILQATGRQVAEGVTGPAEMRRVRRALSRAVALTLAKHPDLDGVAVATDFQRPPLSDEVLRVLQDPGEPLDPERVRFAFNQSRYDLEAIDLDGYELVVAIRNQFLTVLQGDPGTRALWAALALRRVEQDTSTLVAHAVRGQALATATTPLLEVDDFFRPFLRSENLFSHTWSLVGRSEIEDRLVEFCEGRTRHSVAVLPGRGGIGKSRLVMGVAHRVREQRPGLIVRMAADTQLVAAEDIAGLPPGPALLILDDAHRRDDLEVVLDMARRRDDSTRLLLASRPYGLARIRSVAARVGYAPVDLLTLDELTELDRTQTVELARQALGENFSHLAEALADATGDSPLVTVVAGRLVAEEALPPGLLSQHEQFRGAVLNRLTEEYVRALSHLVEPFRARQILELTAAIGPVRPDDDRLMVRMSGFLTIETHELRRALGAMEEAGILIERAGRLRITPDVLADHLYYAAAVSGGRATGYVERVFNSFSKPSPAEVLGNLAELDWQVRQAQPQIDLLGEVWESISAEFAGASHYARVQILKLMERVAMVQPGRVLGLVKLALREPADRTDDGETFFPRSWSHTDVVRATAPLLKRIAYDPDHRERALDLLWQISSDDPRPPQRDLDHGIRILSDLAGYDTGRLDIANSVLDSMERWMAREDAHSHVHSALEVIDPLLEKAGSRTEARGHSFVFTPYFVNPETTRDLRTRALDVVERLASTQDLGVVLRAIKTLGTALRDPMGHFGSAPSDELRQSWVPEQLRVLDLLGELVASGRDPLVVLAAMDAVAWHACYSRRDALRQPARAILESVPWTFELLLTKHLVGAYGRADTLGECRELAQGESLADHEHPDRWERRAERLSSERDQLADELVGRFQDPENGAEVLLERLKTAWEAGQSTSAGAFLHTLARRHPGYGLGLARRAMARPEAQLALWGSDLITGFRTAEPDLAADLTSEFAFSDHASLRAAAAGVCGHVLYSASDARYVEFLRKLLNDKDEAVLSRCMQALAVLCRRDRQEAISVARDVELVQTSSVADDFFMAIAGGNPRGFAELDRRTAVEFLFKLEQVDRLTGYWIDEFLNHASKVAPRELIQLILRRARTGAGRGIHFEAMPHRLESSFTGFAEVEDRGDLLREIRDLWAEAEGGVRYWIPELFSTVSQGHDPVTQTVLQEWIETGDAELISAAAELVAPAEWRFVLRNPDFVVGLIDRAAEAGSGCLRAVLGSLHRSVGTRGGIGVPGEPMPHDVEVRDRARSIAETLTPDSPERRFYEAVAAESEVSIRRDLERDAERGGG